jgi:hypothetical protein
LKRKTHLTIGPKGKVLLKAICDEQTQKRKPETFLTLWKTPTELAAK